MLHRIRSLEQRRLLHPLPIDRHVPLLDPLHRLLPILNDPSFAPVVLSTLERHDGRTKVDDFGAAEGPDGLRVGPDRLVAVEVLLENVAEEKR